MFLDKVFYTCSVGGAYWTFTGLNRLSAVKVGTLFATLTVFGYKSMNIVEGLLNPPKPLTDESKILNCLFGDEAYKAKCKSADEYVDRLRKLKEVDRSLVFTAIVNLEYVNNPLSDNVYYETFSTIDDLIQFVKVNELVYPP